VARPTAGTIGSPPRRRDPNAETALAPMINAFMGGEQV
jgi:hypothetical protein